MWSLDPPAPGAAAAADVAPALVDGSFTVAPLGGAAAGAAPPLYELSLGEGDAVTCAAALEREPFVLLGCRSGDVRVALAADVGGGGAAAGRQAQELRLLPYTSESGHSSCPRQGGGVASRRLLMLGSALPLAPPAAVPFSTAVPKSRTPCSRVLQAERLR
jgi:hypothetical protein